MNGIQQEGRTRSRIMYLCRSCSKKIIQWYFSACHYSEQAMPFKYAIQISLIKSPGCMRTTLSRNFWQLIWITQCFQTLVKSNTTHSKRINNKALHPSSKSRKSFINKAVWYPSARAAVTLGVSRELPSYGFTWRRDDWPFLSDQQQQS